MNESIYTNFLPGIDWDMYIFEDQIHPLPISCGVRLHLYTRDTPKRIYNIVILTYLLLNDNHRVENVLLQIGAW